MFLRNHFNARTQHFHIEHFVIMLVYLLITLMLIIIEQTFSEAIKVASHGKDQNSIISRCILLIVKRLAVACLNVLHKTFPMHAIVLTLTIFLDWNGKILKSLIIRDMPNKLYTFQSWINICFPMICISAFKHDIRYSISKY